MNTLNVIVMAAGKGTRMQSATPKVLQRLGGKPLVQHVLDTAFVLNAQQVVVVTGHAAEVVESALLKANPDKALRLARQMPQLGTGHCVQQAAPLLAGDDSITLILSGDVPLTKPETLQTLIAQCAGKHLALLTIAFDDPTGYGRIVRDASGVQVAAIVEHKDASAEQRMIHECYSGIMAAPTKLLKTWLAKLDNRNAAGEFYLTDVPKHAVAGGTKVLATCITDTVQVDGVNSPVQLAALERALQARIALALMGKGVRLADPARLDVRGSLECGSDVDIDVNCIFAGEVRLGNRVIIGSHCVITDAVIGDDVVIQPFTHMEGQAGKPVRVGAHARVGPFARLRPGTVLGDDVHIGNFVEVKNATLAKGAKANHLAYVGDATVGERVNYGAGSITANYDGVNKHQTVIEADVRVGSNCVLVAPVTVGANGTIGAGSIVTKNTPAGALTVARGKQISLENWVRPVKQLK
ncbi:MAG: bifunctional UDP-N-acetylglucosamine diphosphorylase/glucosamine-1-phosphate N-acetyltransferase GlmU [Cytophagales bacterium]|nr:bifunctional UDP-N-acetylglucosamine diphosphorylase/glucosamine-1-phosphate N-acetyltransferase GlmU [Cytophagales bacterium]